ncbi:rhamnogalacturonan acetylesterase [Flavisericum labens]|uniref:rhamnogalacturonan acetylesterase n=1 Tax=Flavisericum labens TaxID=3377112 RepID=UPI00387AC667
MKPIFRGVLFLFIAGVFYTAPAQNEGVNKIFYFGKKVKDLSEIVIDSAKSYTEEAEYGFDFGSEKNLTFKKNFFTSNNSSIYFSVKVPEGNYRVELVLGGNKCSNTTVKAESRRLMLKEKKLGRNEEAVYSFVVNVRSPKISESSSIKLKDRDKNQLNWDDKLTLEFLGNPSVQRIIITPANNVKTFFLAGDSTVTDQDVEPWASWGQFFTNYLNDDVVVANYAESGSSLVAFKGVKRLEKILSLIKKGDYLFIEFAHNDEKRRGEGIGPWQSYTQLLKEYINAVKSKGGNPVLVTPTQRRAFNKDGTLKATHGDYPAAMRKVANDLNVPLIDVTKMTTQMYESWGVEPSRKAFVQYPANTFPNQPKPLNDNTHFNSFGANEIAKSVVQGIRDLNLEIIQYLKPDIPNYNPAGPDSFSNWTLPMSSRFEIKKPEGN